MAERRLRSLADEYGAMLVLDEIRLNFRASNHAFHPRSVAIPPVQMADGGCHVGVGSSVSGGHWSDLGAEPDSSDVAPDMYCQCKALANGHPLAALIGNERKHLLPFQHCV